MSTTTSPPQRGTSLPLINTTHSFQQNTHQSSSPYSSSTQQPPGYTPLTPSPSAPLPSSTRRPKNISTSRRATEPHAAPKSAGYKSPISPSSKKNLRFGKEEGIGNKRRYSAEPGGIGGGNGNGKVNVYTECGRHGDEWLFGGFSVAGVVRKMWPGKESGEKTPTGTGTGTGIGNWDRRM